MSIGATFESNARQISATVQNNTSALGAKVYGGGGGGNGKDGFSPTVDIEQITGGYRITVTDAQGLESFDLLHGRDGEDGYTPVKGVDYFDGADGKDGYTPIKGKDYFDGQDGETGARGVGISLIEQEVAVGDDGQQVIYITLTNGEEHTFYVYNGSKGASGDPGKDGLSIYELSAIATTSEGYTLVEEKNISIPEGRTIAVGDLLLAPKTNTIYKVEVVDYYGAVGLHATVELMKLSYTLTEQDKSDIVNAVISALPVYGGEVTTV